MTDNTAEEQIPWHFFNTKTLRDGEELAKVGDLTDLQARAISRRGYVTRALKRIQSDKEYFEKIRVQGKQSHARYEESRSFLELRMAMVVNVYRRILQIVPLDKQIYPYTRNSLPNTCLHL